MQLPYTWKLQADNNRGQKIQLAWPKSFRGVWTMNPDDRGSIKETIDTSPYEVEETTSRTEEANQADGGVFCLVKNKRRNLFPVLKNQIKRAEEFLDW